MSMSVVGERGPARRVKRYLKLWAVAVLSAVLGISVVPGRAQADPLVGHWMIYNKHSGLCVTTNSGVGMQFYCDLLEPWEVYNQGSNKFTFLNIYSGKCLSVKNNSLEQSALVKEAACNGQSTTLWLRVQVAEGYQFVNQNSNMCLTVSGASLDVGANLIQFPCNTTAPHNETWGTFPVFVD